MKGTIILLLASLTTLLVAPLALAQRGDPVRSPEVGEDGRVTFRLRAPEADAVTVYLSGTGELPLERDEVGVWSVTTNAIEPDIYPYSFTVDGLTIPDPVNPMTKPTVMAGSQSLVHVPGPDSLSWEVDDVPRGVVHHHVYRSEIAGEDRDYYVYTPPGYDPAGPETYPVLYLFHGLTDDASAWTSVGRAHVILDNLIASDEAKPMLIVMPLGYPFPDIQANIFAEVRGATSPATLVKWTRTVLDELVPRVESDYRVAADRDHRAVAGLSMGGAQALHVGLNHPDRFAHVASFSGATVMYGDTKEDFVALFPDLPDQVAGTSAPETEQTVWLGCGTEDFLIKPHRAFVRWLNAQDIPHTVVETPGAGHEWMLWRRYLTDLASRLFRDRRP